MAKRRKDGFKKAGSTLRIQGKLDTVEVQLYLDPSTGEFMIPVADKEFRGKELRDVKKEAAAYLDGRHALSWTRYFDVAYHAEAGPREGQQHSYHLDVVIPEGTIIKSVEFDFEVFELSNPIDLDAQSVLKNRYRGGPVTQERRKRRLRRNHADTDWEVDTHRWGINSSTGEESVSVNYLAEYGSRVCVEYTEERYQGLLAIQAALKSLDHKMRTMFKHKDLSKLLENLNTKKLLGA